MSKDSAAYVVCVCVRVRACVHDVCVCACIRYDQSTSVRSSRVSMPRLARRFVGTAVRPSLARRWHWQGTALLLVITVAVQHAAGGTNGDRGSDSAVLDRLGPLCRSLINPRMPPHSVPPPTHLARLFWLHVPKSGTSFGATVWKYACPAIPDEVFTPEGQKRLTATAKQEGRLGMTMHLFEQHAHLCPVDAFATARRWVQAKTSAVKGHTALPKPLAESGQGLLMLRDPVKRLCSAFQFKHTVGMAPAQRKKLLATATTPAEFLNFSGVASCATKMLTQSNCAQDATVTPATLRVAQNRLRKAFAFVGITDYWNASMCLFHAQLGGRPQPFAFANNRPSSRWTSTAARKAAVERIRGCRQVSNSDEPNDNALYDSALALFAERLCDYGLRVPTALHHMLTDNKLAMCPQAP